MVELSQFEREFLRTLPREVFTFPGPGNPLSKAEREAVVRLQAARLISVSVKTKHSASAMMTDAGRRAMGLAS